MAMSLICQPQVSWQVMGIALPAGLRISLMLERVLSPKAGLPGRDVSNIL